VRYESELNTLITLIHVTLRYKESTGSGTTFYYKPTVEDAWMQRAGLKRFVEAVSRGSYPDKKPSHLSVPLAGQGQKPGRGQGQ
jgi:hypothetical protein